MECHPSTIRNTFFGVINDTHTFAVCKWVTTTSSDMCELKVIFAHRYCSGICMSKYDNFTNFSYVCNKSDTNQNVLIEQPLITIICVNRFHQSMTGRLSKNKTYILCNRPNKLPTIEVT